MNKKKILIWAGAGLALLALLLYVLLAVSKASVIEANGPATVTRGGKELQAKKDLKLKDADALTTRQNGGLWVRLDKNKTVLLDENSEMKLEGLGKEITLTFVSGAALIRSDQALKPDESFEIQVGSATISVREACVFSIHYNASGDATLNVYQGEISVYGKDKAAITLKKGQSIRIDPNTGAPVGEMQPIDYSLLPEAFLDNVQDYAKEAGYIKESTQSSPPEAASEPSEAESEESGEQDADVATGATTETSGQDTGSLPGAEDEAAAAASNMPIISFKYMWDGAAFKPYADISWTHSEAAYIEWRLCDQNGSELAAGGRFDAAAGGVNLQKQIFNVSPPNGRNLYPMGSTIRLTPYHTSSQDGNAVLMTPIMMELPYFEVETERSGGQLTPVIFTNIGFYFEHSYEALTDRVENNRIRITGSLLPLEGTKIPLQINAVSP